MSIHPRRLLPWLTLAILAGASAAAFLLGCSRSSGDLVLQPLAGKSKYRTVQVAGDFNPALYGSFDLTRAPRMVYIGDGVWRVVVNGVTAGDHLFKLVTNGAFDNPPDFGGSEANLLSVGGGAASFPVLLVTGQGTGLHARFASGGNYQFTLDEVGLTCTIEKYTVAEPASIHGVVAFSPPPAAPLKAYVSVFRSTDQQQVAFDSTVAASGVFDVGGLAAGAYRVKLAAAGYVDSTVSVTLAAGQSDSLGTVVLHQGCVSAYDKIQVAGDLNTALYGSFDLTKAPEMTRAGCVWQATVTVTAGQHLFKLVTNGAFDTPKDFGGSEADCKSFTGATLTTPVLQVSGTGTALCVNFPSDGDYRFTLNEGALSLTVERLTAIQGGTLRGSVALSGSPAPGQKVYVRVAAQGTGAVVNADSTAGSFQFEGVPAGSYSVTFSAAGYLDSTRAAVVAAGQTTDMGVTQLQSGCFSAFTHIQVAGDLNTALYGNFDLTQAPQMTHIAGCVWQATVNVTAGQHLFKLVTNGAFDNPPDYGGLESNCLTFTGGSLLAPVLRVTGAGTALCAVFPSEGSYIFTLDEGARTLSVESCLSTHSVIQLASDLTDPNGFQLNLAPHMVRTAGCVWQVDVSGVTAGDHYFKFVTDSAYADPSDYGGDDNCASFTGASYAAPVLVVTTQAGGNLCLTFSQAGNYRFTLDEGAQSYKVEKLTSASRRLRPVAVRRPARARPSLIR